MRAGLPAGPHASSSSVPRVRRLAVVAMVFLVGAAEAGAHVPSTSIGRAVEAFASVPVSYEVGAAVTDIEAGNFPPIVGSDPKVAFMPASASSEMIGGPDAIADEIAREAALEGTLIVLVGTKLGSWSTDIGDDRLAELIQEARAGSAGAPAATVAALVRSVQAEPTNETSWAWVAAGLAVLAIGSFVVFERVSRRRPESSR